MADGRSSDGWRLHGLAVGPRRTGTTWLHRCLQQRPELALPRRKETRYWSRYFDRGEAWYRRQFPEEGRPVEVCPEYFADPEVRRRIEDACQGLRVIVTVRDPVDRAWSHYRHERAKGRVGDDFWEAVERRPAILADGRYRTHLPAWEALDAVDRVEAIPLDEVAARPADALERAARALGVEPWETPPMIADEVVNPARAARSPLAARLVTTAGRALRSAGLEGLLTRLRSGPIGRAVRGLAWSEPDARRDGAAGGPMPDDLRARLAELLDDERTFLRERGLLA